MDERTAPIEVGKETWIEIDKEGKGLGLCLLGGLDTIVGKVVIHEVYEDGAASMDGRLKPGDELVEVNGTRFSELSHQQAIALLRRTPAKVRMLIYRDERSKEQLDASKIQNVYDIELTKKLGRCLGLSIVGRKMEPGVYVSDVVKGGVAEADGRIMHGDQILAVNNQDVTSSMQEDVATMLKTISGRVVLKIGRWKLNEGASFNNNNNNSTTQQQTSISENLNKMNHRSNTLQLNNNNNNNNDQLSTMNGQTTTTKQQTVSFETGSTNFMPSSAEPLVVSPPPPAPIPSTSFDPALNSSSGSTTIGYGGAKMPPSLQITLLDENQTVIRTDLSPVTEEDLKSIAETTASSEEAQHSSSTIPSHGIPLSTQKRFSISNINAAILAQQQQANTSGSASSTITSNLNNNNNNKTIRTPLRLDLKEENTDSLLVQLRKDDGNQWGMGIGKRQRGILITSLQPGSTAAEKLCVGDRIMAVNGTAVNDQVTTVSLVRESGNFVTLQVARPKSIADRGNISSSTTTITTTSTIPTTTTMATSKTNSANTETAAKK